MTLRPQALVSDRWLAELLTLDTEALIRAVFRDSRFGRVATVSSFGAEAAVLLHLVSRVAPGAPVLFVNTLRIFGETLRYSRELATRLGLTDLRTIAPARGVVDSGDPKGDLWLNDPDACCHIRKVAPLNEALAGFDTWISGRKHHQSRERSALQKVEWVDGRFKINPLADWSRERIDTYFEEHDLPQHPLKKDGFLSIGCFPCTDRVQPGEDPRAGRWRGRGKTECGIHLSVPHSAGRLPTR